MALYGATETRYDRFRGFVPDVDPNELAPELASDALNVDFEGENLLKRKGKSKYNASVPVASAVNGLHAFYPADGSTRKVLVQAGTVVYEDNGSGTFSSKVTGLTGGVPFDFAQYKDVVYAGNSVDALRKRDNTGTWGQVAGIVAPAAAPTTALAQTILEAFDSGTWTLSGSAITTSFATDIKLEGTGCLKVQATASGAKGSFVYKAWSASAGATVDLSRAEYVIVWYYAEKIGITFQVAVADNTALPGALNFSNFPAFTTQQKETWVPIRVPLSAIPPASRTASTGFGIKWVSPPSNATLPVAVYFDQAMAESGQDADSYSYFATYAQYGTDTSGNAYLIRESNPSPAGAAQINDLPPVAGVTVTETASGDGSVNAINLYRFRANGTLRRAVMVGSLPNAATTLSAAITTTTQATAQVTSILGMSVGAILTIGSEQLLVTGITGNTLAVTRGYGGTTAATHINGTAVSATTFLDTFPDSTLILNDAVEIIDGKIDPPLAATYAVANGRLVAGNVTVGGVSYPYRVYLSRLAFPEEFGSTEQTAQTGSDPTVAGWFDLPTKDPIRRIVEFDGTALIFCDREIWALDGSGWDDFQVRKRANVGLDARWAVVGWERNIYFLAADGVRVLGLNKSFYGVMDTWLISEPVGSLLRAIPASSRKNAAMGIDERGRVQVAITRAGQSANDAALVFDTRVDGAVDDAYNRQRPGWTYYTNWQASVLHTLRRGGGDNGELLAGDPATAQVWKLNQGEVDDASAVSWSWTSRVEDGGTGAHLELVYVGTEWLPAASQNVTATPYLDRVASSSPLTLSLGAATTGVVFVDARTAPDQRGRFLQLQLAGSHSVPMQLSSAALGVYRRQ